MDLTPITRKEHFLAKAAGNADALDLEPITREEWFISQIQGGTGGSVTPADVVTATGDMTSAQKAQTRENLDVDPKKFVANISETGGVLSADKRYDEIETAYWAGKTIVAKDESGIHFPLVNYSALGTMAFSIVSDGRIKTYSVEHDGVGDTDAWSYAESSIQSAPSIITVSGATPTIEPAANTIYNCGTLTSLTISNPTATGAYSIVFTSGATATTTTIPATILGLESFAAEANTLYEINVLDNRAVVGSWAVSV